MKNSIRLLVGMSVILLGAAFAGEPSSDLSAKEAVRLIAMKSNVQANTIEISFVVDGVSKSGCFDISHARRVAAIHGVRENAGSSRRLVFYDLFWNESLGWFMWESRHERTGEAVYLWSELRGEIVNR